MSLPIYATAPLPMSHLENLKALRFQRGVNPVMARELNLLKSLAVQPFLHGRDADFVVRLEMIAEEYWLLGEVFLSGVHPVTEEPLSWPGFVQPEGVRVFTKAFLKPDEAGHAIQVRDEWKPFHLRALVNKPSQHTLRGSSVFNPLTGDLEGQVDLVSFRTQLPRALRTLGVW